MPGWLAGLGIYAISMISTVNRKKWAKMKCAPVLENVAKLTPIHLMVETNG